jgi:hypothetical protein
LEEEGAGRGVRTGWLERGKEGPYTLKRVAVPRKAAMWLENMRFE